MGYDQSKTETSVCQRDSLTFEQRVEDRIERQIKLAEENNRLMELIASALERIANSKSPDINPFTNNGKSKIS